jgi:hypothetical protein
VRITGDIDPFLRIALTSHSGFAVGSMDIQEEYQVTILDRVSSAVPLDSPALIIFPPEDLEGFELVRVWAAPMEVSFHPGHPATGNARFRQFRTAGILQTSYPEGFEVLAAARGIPVILAGRLNGHRTIVWNFDPRDNGIYLDPAYPVMLRDTVNWLARSGQVVIETQGCADGKVDPQTCSSLTREAAAVNIPDLADLRPETLAPGSDSRRDLGKQFLITALLLILILALERVQTRRSSR